MGYLVKDFDCCVFNPLTKSGLSIDEIYPELRDREGFLVGSFGIGLDRDKVIRWIMALYQPESPLVRDYVDYKVRRYQAGLLVGFGMSKDGSGFSKLYMEVVLGLNGRVNRFIVDFCRILRDDDYSEMRVYQDKLYRMLGVLAESDKATDDKVILLNIEELKRRIEVLRKKYLVGDDDGRLVEEMRAVMDHDYIDMSREAVVRRIEMKEDIYGERFVPPYGRDYVKKYYEDVNRRRFLGASGGIVQSVS
jgi:hypothetical protein